MTIYQKILTDQNLSSTFRRLIASTLFKELEGTLYIQYINRSKENTSYIGSVANLYSTQRSRMNVEIIVVINVEIKAIISHVVESKELANQRKSNKIKCVHWFLDECKGR